MQTPLKRSLDLTSAIITTVIGGFEILGGVIAFFGGVISLSVLSSGSWILIATVIGVIIGSFFDVGLGIANTVLGAKTCYKPIDTEEGRRARRRINIALVVLLSIVTFLGLLSLPMGFLTFAGAATALGFKIAVMLLPDMPEEAIVSDTPSSEPVFEEEVAVAASVEVKAETPVPPVEVKAEAPQPAATTTMSVEEKLTELKRLKEVGVLTEEQYQSAVQKVIDSITK